MVLQISLVDRGGYQCTDSGTRNRGPARHTSWWPKYAAHGRSLNGRKARVKHAARPPRKINNIDEPSDREYYPRVAGSSVENQPVAGCPTPDCKSVYAGSIPTPASIQTNTLGVVGIRAPGNIFANG